MNTGQRIAPHRRRAVRDRDADDGMPTVYFPWNIFHWN